MLQKPLWNAQTEVQVSTRVPIFYIRSDISQFRTRLYSIYTRYSTYLLAITKPCTSYLHVDTGTAFPTESSSLMPLTSDAFHTPTLTAALP
jgi:hypothetical protein